MSLIVFALLLTSWLYARGTRAVWRAAGRGRGVRTWQAAGFTVGILTVSVALVSPFETLTEELFSAHMAQHLLLMSLAPPLLALGDAPLALLWALSRANRVRIGRAVTHLSAIKLLQGMPLAFVLHSMALWLWHAPPLYEGALRNPTLHAFEHLTLLATALLFWSLALRGLTRVGHTPGATILYIFVLGAQCTGLGALIALAQHPWYAFYSATTSRFGLSPLDDQVLAGALMWVPAGFVYLTFALVLLGVWLRPKPALTRAAPVPALQPPAQAPGA